MNTSRLLPIFFFLVCCVPAFAQPGPPVVTFTITAPAEPFGVDADDTINVSGTHENAMAGKVALYSYDGSTQTFIKVIEVDITLGQNDTWTATLTPPPGDTWPVNDAVIAVSDEALPASFTIPGTVPGKASVSGEITAP
jgi:hypothetical protein